MSRFLIYCTDVLIGLFIVLSFYSMIRADLMMVSETFYPVVLLICTVSLITICLFAIYLKKIRWTRLALVVVLWGFYVVCHTFIISQNAVSWYTLLWTQLWWVIAFMYGYWLGSFDTIDRLRNIFLIILPILLTMLVVVSIARTTTQQIQINYVFYIIMLLPYFATIFNQRLRSAMFLVIFVACAFSLKRSAIIIAFLCMMVYLWYILKHSKNTVWVRLGAILVLIIISAFSFRYINNLTDGRITERFTDLEDDGGSGRTELYENVLNTYRNLPWLDKCLGKGYNAVYLTQASGNELSAHNDFIEVLYDYGLCGFLLYMLIWLYLIKRFFRLKRSQALWKLSYGLSIVIFGVLSLISQLIIYPTFFVGLTLFWGYIEGLISQNKYYLLNA